MNDQDVWSAIADALRRGERAVLVAVVEARGETPGKPGFKMAVRQDGACAGSVGGGAIEHEAVERARILLGEPAPGAYFIRRRHRDEGGDDDSGMICGGEQTLVFAPLAPGDLPVVETLEQAGPSSVGLALTPHGAAPVGPGESGAEISWSARSEAEWRYEEPPSPCAVVYIAGGGHVALALSRALAPLDFRVLVYDDRPDVPTIRENAFADEIRIGPFHDFHRAVRPGPGSYVVIMTPSHRYDEAVLRSVIRLPVRYIGMMASPTKAARVRDHLLREGYAREDVERVRSPIGIVTTSRTPAEIAVSIAAELIKVRREPSYPS